MTYNLDDLRIKIAEQYNDLVDELDTCDTLSIIPSSIDSIEETMNNLRNLIAMLLACESKGEVINYILDDIKLNVYER
jgi:hypothetical protein